MNAIASFDDAMAFIWERSGYDRGFISNPFAGDDAARLGLVRTRYVLDALGNPERDYPIVHVAGSKGKGSTCSFVDSILRAMGLRSGRFLSPHLHTFQERFVVDDEPIGRDDFTALVREMHPAIHDVEHARPEFGQLTAWEISTAMALLWFSRQAVEAAVIEVGLGGTLDATNVVHPAVAVITRLDYEHTSILGATMTEIAANKAGIIKPGVVALTAAQPDDGMTVISDRAREVGAPLLEAGVDWSVAGSDADFRVDGPGWRHDYLRSPLAGRHQIDNAGLAIAAVHALAGRVPLSQPLTDQAVREGVGSAFLAGRFEVVTAPGGGTVVLDGAHSPASTTALAAAMQERYPGARVTIVIGMLADKDPAAVLAPLESIASRWIAAPLQSPRSRPAEALAATLSQWGVVAESAASVAGAIEAATVEPGAIVLVTGSLSTVAEARVALGLATAGRVE